MTPFERLGVKLAHAVLALVCQPELQDLPSYLFGDADDAANDLLREARRVAKPHEVVG